ncbi:MAG: hypothetical protein JSU65_09495 [Candidatus Zixiibacteriota bacterium]|nr:MAG: hypothetical protein JSU65_09495 [candidate division Zixibacteria bacterium]
MRNRKQHSYDTTADRAYTMHCSSGIVTLVVACLVAILTFCPSVHSRNDLRCGDEVRLVSQTGEVLQGRLTNAADDSLAVKIWHGKFGFRTVPRNDIAGLYRVKRRTFEGIVVGTLLGAGVGVIAAKAYYKQWKDHHPDRWRPDAWFGPFIEMGSMIVGGTIIGAVVGGMIGHHTQRLGEVQLEATPMCISTRGEVEPLGVTLAISF